MCEFLLILNLALYFTLHRKMNSGNLHILSDLSAVLASAIIAMLNYSSTEVVLQGV